MEDVRFIKRVIREQPENIKRAAVEDYVLMYLNAYSIELNETKKQNKGRFAANTFLREVICPNLSH